MNQEHYDKLKECPRKWNEWRRENPDVIPNLTRADLTWANLTGANLTRANLTGANLTGADLTRAGGVCRELQTPLMMLLDQPGRIRLYKLVTAALDSPMSSTKVLRYDIGSVHEVPDADEDINRDCSRGLHVATLDWCLKNRQECWRVMIVEFSRHDIACIPLGTDGKIRVRKLKVIGEKDISGMVGQQTEASK